MTPEEFADRLQHVEKRVSEATSYFSTWEVLGNADEDEVRLMNRYNSIFVPAKVGLQLQMLQTVANLFDRDSRTASFPNLVKAIEEQPDFVPNSAEVVRRVRTTLDGLMDPIKKLMKVRNQFLSHFDATSKGLPGVTLGEFRQTLKGAQEALDELTKAHHRATTSYGQVKRRSETQFGRLMRDLQEARDRDQALVDQTRQPDEG